MTPIEEEKYKLRKKMEKERNTIDEKESMMKSEQICDHVLAHPLFANRSHLSQLTICTYMPFRSECDITPVMEWCWEQGVKVLVPRANRLRRSLHIHRIEGYDDLETGAWGIREPKETAVEWDHSVPIDLIFVPGLAFDSQGGRLGYGGGYYDGFIRACQRAPWPTPHLMSVAFNIQVVEQVPMEQHDLKVDIIITESGMIKDGPLAARE